MTYEVLAGALVGLGLFLFIRALIPSKPDPMAAIARIDALRQQTSFTSHAPTEEPKGFTKLKHDLGVSVNEVYIRHPWRGENSVNGTPRAGFRLGKPLGPPGRAWGGDGGCWRSAAHRRAARSGARL